ncbi:MAG TPA: hypothetical protein VLE02_01050 [Nitrosarchaeum sp.]|nr:hypothetical protein [Nitrosarchaeum sp.]
MILTQINYKQVIKKFLGSKKKSEDVYTTDLHESDEKSDIFMYDSNKNREVWKVCMLDSKFNVLSNYTNTRCWWDRHKFTTSPLGCPLKYHTVNSIHYSSFRERLAENNITIKDEVCDFFETEGIFCSFCCIMSYIDNEIKKGNNRYSEYISLVYLLLWKLKKRKDVKIPCAGSWKVLIDYGGDVNIQTYREKFADFFYEETGIYKRPYMVTTPFYIKETTPKYLTF